MAKAIRGSGLQLGMAPVVWGYRERRGCRSITRGCRANAVVVHTVQVR
jgi:hypothetical protein